MTAFVAALCLWLGGVIIGWVGFLRNEARVGAAGATRPPYEDSGLRNDV
jgi:hypothetical protein